MNLNFNNFSTRVKQTALKPRFLSFVPDEDEDSEIKMREIILRVLVAIITASWIGFLPFYLFLIYMNYNSFFSYDFFTEGVFGINTFIIASSLILVFFSLLLYGFLIIAKLGIIEKKRTGKNGYRWFAWVMFAVSIFIHFLMFIASLSKDNPFVFLWITLISIIISLFIFVFVGHGFVHNIRNWRASAGFIMLTILLPFMNQNVTSEVVSIGLRSFQMGGGLNIAVGNKLDEVGKEAIVGKLSLITPYNAYLKNSDGQSITVPRSEHTTVRVW